jgi:hypothetical protein
MVRRTYETGELTRSEIFQRNERIKSVSSLCVNLGTALLVAGAARWFYTAIDEYTMLWLISGPVVIWSGLHILALLEAEI